MMGAQDPGREGIDGRRLGFSSLVLALAITAGAATGSRALAQSQEPARCAFSDTLPEFPRIEVCAFAGAYRDSSSIGRPRACWRHYQSAPPDSIQERPRTITVRFRRDRRIEARPDFGGYRIYRVVNRPDTTQTTLIRRYSRQAGDERTWSFSIVDTSDLGAHPNFMCDGQVVHDSLVTFIDPDSNGNFVRVCRVVDQIGRCLTRGDSVIKLIAPPGPHDGFRTWYSVTIEKRNTTEATYEDLFVPDLTGKLGPCRDPSDPTTCPNLNNRAYSLSQAVEPTPGPTPNLERVGVVPNPFRAGEFWDQTGAHELHFINLPPRATIRIYTVAGDLVARLDHNDRIRDFERWDLKNQRGRDVASGIYVYRVESDAFEFQDRFIVIR